MVAAHSLLFFIPLFLSPTAVVAQCPAGVYAAAGALLSSYAPAQSYCSSKYPIAPKTSVVTAYTTSTTTASTVFGTVTVSTTTTTVTAAAVTVPTTVTTETVTRVVATMTATQTDTTSTTVTQTIFQKAKRAVTTTPAKASTTSKDPKQSAFSSLVAQANAFVSTVCVKCIETARTFTSTTTLPVFTGITASSTASVTATSTATTTPTVFSTVTATSTSDVTQTVSETTTTTVRVTETVAATRPGGPPCNDPGTDTRGAGGCSSNCYCDRNPPTNAGVCDAAEPFCSDAACSTDADCAIGQACVTSNNIEINCGHALCVPVGGCTSSISKRDLFGFGAGDFGGRRMGKRASEGRRFVLLDGEIVRTVNGQSFKVSDGTAVQVSNGRILSDSSSS